MRTDATPVIVAAARTPIGTAGHSLADVTVEQLAAPVLASLLSRSGLDAGAVDEVVLGNCLGPGGNVARVSALAAGLPESVPALTVDRQCASGLAAVDLAAQLVRNGAGVVLAGGAESASTAPWRFWPPEAGGEPLRYERAPFAPAPDDLDMGLANDLLATESGVTRERQDAYAARSHRLGAAARDAGLFDDEIVPVAGTSRDERPRAGLTPQRLARLPAAFRPEGTVTAGNACGISDGAAAVAVVSEEVRLRLGRSRPARPGQRHHRRLPSAPGTGPGARRATRTRAGRDDPGPARRHRAQRGVRRTGAGVLRRARASTPTACAPMGARSPWGIRGGRRVRCSW